VFLAVAVVVVLELVPRLAAKPLEERNWPRIREATYARAAIIHFTEVLSDLGMVATHDRSWTSLARHRWRVFLNRQDKLSLVGHRLLFLELHTIVSELFLALSEPERRVIVATIRRRATAAVETLEELGALKWAGRIILSIARAKKQTIDELACSKLFERHLMRELRRRHAFGVLYEQ